MKGVLINHSITKTIVTPILEMLWLQPVCLWLWVNHYFWCKFRIAWLPGHESKFWGYQLWFGMSCQTRRWQWLVLWRITVYQDLSSGSLVMLFSLSFFSWNSKDVLTGLLLTFSTGPCFSQWALNNYYIIRHLFLMILWPSDRINQL